MTERSTEARWIALLLVTAAVLYLCWLMLRPFASVLAWAAVLVILFFPVHRRILTKTGKRSTSALISTLLAVVTILIPLGLILLALVAEARGIVQYIQERPEAFFDPDNSPINRLVGWLNQYVNVDAAVSSQAILDQLKALSARLASQTLDLVGGVLGTIIQIFFVIFTMYYLFRDGDRIMSALPGVLPLEPEQSERIFTRTREVINASVYGVVVIGIVQGGLGGIAFWALGLPSAIVWAVVMMFLSMIPIAGAFLVWIPAALYLAFTGAWIKAVVLTVWGVFVVGTVDNILRPKLVGGRTRLHELFVFFSVLGGLAVFGILGIIMGPVTLAVMLALLDVFRQPSNASAPALTEAAKATENS